MQQKTITPDIILNILSFINSLKKKQYREKALRLHNSEEICSFEFYMVLSLDWSYLSNKKFQYIFRAKEIFSKFKTKIKKNEKFLSIYIFVEEENSFQLILTKSE